MISLAISEFVPSSLTIIGTEISSFMFLHASTIPFATLSHLTIPPKILTRIAFTLGSLIMILKAVSTLSLSAVPPTSKKLAGSPPACLIKSMVAIAKPAPLTIHPTFPSKST